MDRETAKLGFSILLQFSMIGGEYHEKKAVLIASYLDKDFQMRPSPRDIFFMISPKIIREVAPTQIKNFSIISSSQEKEHLLTTAYEIAMADGHLDEDEIFLLEQMERRFGMNFLELL